MGIDKGVRAACNAKFMELLHTRAEVGNTEFRRAVMQFCIREYGVTLAASAGHYNNAFKLAKQLALTNAALAAQLEGLGRAEDKKGGRKSNAYKAAQAAAATQSSSDETNEYDELLQQQLTAQSSSSDETDYDALLHANDSVSVVRVYASNVTEEEAAAIIAKNKKVALTVM